MINTTGIDRTLIDALRQQCTLSDLGEIFLGYQIPVEKRHDVHNINLLKGLICYIFRNSEKPIAIKMEDSFKVPLKNLYFKNYLTLTLSKALY